MAKPKFNYDGEDFYKEIYALAMQGLNNAEIAYNLGDNLGVAEDEYIVPYSTEVKGLTPEVFSKMLNGKYQGWNDEEKKGKVTRKRYNIVNGVKDEDNMVMEESESIQETAPNMQALANFLYHHDTEFRNIQKGIEEGDINIKVKNGVNISAWLEKENEEAKDNGEE